MCLRGLWHLNSLRKKILNLCSTTHKLRKVYIIISIHKTDHTLEIFSQKFSIDLSSYWRHIHSEISNNHSTWMVNRKKMLTKIDITLVYCIKYAAKSDSPVYWTRLSSCNVPFYVCLCQKHHSYDKF